MSEDIIKMLRESADDYLAANVDLEQQKGRVGEPILRNRQQWQTMADLGWLGLALPEAQGGMAMGIDAGAALCEVFGRRLLPEAYIAGALIPSVILGSSQAAQAQRYAEDLAAGSGLFTLAWQEQTAEADSDLYGTECKLVAGEYRVSGRKRFVCALEDDGVMLVAASSSQGTVVVPVAADAAGISISRVATAQGSYAEVELVEAIAGEPLLSGEQAQAAISRAIAWARVACAAQLTGIARGCLEATTEYVAQRRQFDRTLSSFQSVAHRCADLLVGIEMSDAVWMAAATQANSAEKPADVAAVYAAKARAGDVAMASGRDAVQLHGAMGFTEECNIGLYLRAAMQYNSWLGVPTGMRREFLARSRQHELSVEACNA